MQGTNRSGEGEGRACYIYDPGSELRRLGGREKEGEYKKRDGKKKKKKDQKKSKTWYLYMACAPALYSVALMCMYFTLLVRRSFYPSTSSTHILMDTWQVLIVLLMCTR